jgi:hypothetical protein
MEKIRLPSTSSATLEAGRLVIVSPFEKRPRRPTTESARQRNDLVAALAHEVFIVHVTPGGQIEEISHLVDRWGMSRWKSQG